MLVFWGEGKTGVPGETPLGAMEKTNNKRNPHMASMLGFEPDHIVGRPVLAPLPQAPPLLLEMYYVI